MVAADSDDEPTRPTSPRMPPAMLYANQHMDAYQRSALQHIELHQAERAASLETKEEVPEQGIPPLEQENDAGAVQRVAPESEAVLNLPDDTQERPTGYYDELKALSAAAVSPSSAPSPEQTVLPAAERTEVQIAPAQEPTLSAVDADEKAQWTLAYLAEMGHESGADGPTRGPSLERLSGDYDELKAEYPVTEIAPEAPPLASPEAAPSAETPVSVDDAAARAVEMSQEKAAELERENTATPEYGLEL